MSQSSQNADEMVYTPVCAIFRRYLKKQGLKFTPERAMILNAVLDRDQVFEAEELLEDMRKDASSRVSKATIYRTLKHLVDANIISEVLIDSRQAHYRLSFGRKQVGHLVCVEHNKVIEFDAPEMQELRDRICKEHHFEPISFRFIVYGTCPEALQDEQAEDAESDEE